MSDDRHKKSWREKDRQRDQSDHTDRPAKKKSNAAPAGYKKDLEKLFQSGGGDLPDRFQGLMDKLKDEETPEEAAWREEVDALRNTEGFRDFVMAATKFHRAGHALPDDEDLLIRLMDHPSERIVQATIEQVLDLSERRGLNRPDPFTNRIKTIRQIAESPRTLQLLTELETKLQS